MSALLFQTITIFADLVIFIFVAFYLFHLHSKEKQLEKKEHSLDSSFQQAVGETLHKEQQLMENTTAGYQQIVNDTLSKEKTILEHATAEADTIITGTKFITQNYTQVVDTALQKMAADIQKEAFETGRAFMNNYSASLQQIASTSLTNFHTIAKSMEEELQKQMKEVSGKILPDVEKELAVYKQSRIAEAEEKTTRVIQKISQEVLNLSISPQDHQKLMIDALEKAKKEGAFS